MKPTSEILERIEKCSSEHKDGVFTRLYRYLLREDIYYAAYQKLYANKGATTQGIDDDTADGFSDFYIKELIQSLKDGTYKANPVRREYIPKKNGKLRPLGIPSFRDKLLQEVVRMILEAIYEPVFDSHSHGFRPGKSCHTALRQISSDFTGVVWFIEGDIQGCFDNINHEKLIEILSRKIKDSRFLNIIRQFLKAGYIENWKYNASYSGSPQGGICSPILANIYLNELDKKFREIAELFDKPRSAYQTLEYHAASKELKRLSYWIDHTSDEAARQELIDQHRAQKKAMRNLPCKPADNKRMPCANGIWSVGRRNRNEDFEMSADDRNCTSRFGVDAFCLVLHGSDLHIRSGAWSTKHGNCSAWRGCADYLFPAEWCDFAGYGIFD